ncbi:bifunctional 4-hydroxy-2-oxoglutarate aldolase/2-dehydro-3-deoxy-phosphogluconate aldolase [Microbacterium sp. 4R-513]|uniref:bifunctional 4-hydroxy-2-oxoglutarate aldolase/2-dehydro-3-deoxy-phosphogluconate aldolase n=1 Tax=Microbacterium sp. 4R-513 TaxID=2567934 RepID=UPI0013E18DB9|nr:bifunctional 4-hydroxy-2-oxoglutarate aldolase/2-dehydro-3-deoxy-phosphogluconate aldolase [Microbacterium sp. 4R-513]QIG39412.1 bifunctional 4-hydroxy-2-oxoglutarate aldolase/2-dehydro-3-deoxy-phosphogluconate aldolase [Microbacterium sp. 4R-513]
MSDEDAVLAIERVRIVPVVVIDDPRHAAPVARALTEGGIPTAEVTLRTPAALEAIAAMSRVDGFVVGAGTILGAADADAAIEAGANYLVSPGLDVESVARAQARGIPFIPGVATATEVQRAHAARVTRVKLFPAGVLGGPKLIEALSGPFPEMRFVPSGGVSLDNFVDYLTLPSVFAVSGSWMVPRAAIAAGAADAIRDLAAEAAAIAKG